MGIGSFIASIGNSLDSPRVPKGIKIGGAVLAVVGLATAQVLYGRSKGAALSQEKPDRIAFNRGPRNLEDEKKLLQGK